MRAAAVGLAGLAALVAGSATADPVARFDRLVRELGPYCVRAASADCYANAFAQADADGDGGLTLAELEALQEQVRDWYAAKAATLTPSESSGIALGLLVVDGVGLGWLVASYDTDGDGWLSPEELAADVALDERPLPVLVRDPAAVDWAGVRGRLGAMGALVLPQLGVP